MNKSKIEWCDYTWNPVTGCWGPGGTAEKPNRCFYCYAQKIAYRFWERFRPPVDHPELWALMDSFAPFFWKYRLSEPKKVKKPSRIFVGSTSDIFGEWVPDLIIHRILNRVLACPWHTFIFLTKNPARYQEFNPWPENCWLLATCENQAAADKLVPELLKADCRVRGVSMEPLLGTVKLRGEKHDCYEVAAPLWAGDGPNQPCVRTKEHFPEINWLIIGAMTGPGSKQHQPEPESVQSLIDQARAADVAVFLKDNLKWPEKIQEFPKC